MKVVHLVRTLDMGGLEMVVFDLVRHSGRESIEPVVVCLGGPGDLAPRFENEGVEVISLHVDRKRLPRRIAALASLLRQLRPDVLHTHNPSPHVNGAIANCFASVPVLVHTKHGRNYPTQKWPVFQNRLASRLSSRIVPVSRDAAEVALRIEKVPGSKVQVIYNGIDVDRFRPRATLKPFSMRAIHVARLNPVKDQPTLLRATRRIVDQIPEFQLEIVGDGPSFAELVQLRDELQLSEHVRFHGMQDDIPARLQDTDMFLLSSVSEGVSLTLLEAMACGLPIVATDVGGNAEVVDHENSGLLVPSGDPASFADAVIRLCRDPDLAKKMGLAGRQRVEEVFSLRSMVRAYEDLYKELLSKPGKQSRSSLDKRESACLVSTSEK